jgi:type II secretory pathway component GspD/PulD (secretin)
MVSRWFDISILWLRGLRMAFAIWQSVAISLVTVLFLLTVLRAQAQNALPMSPSTSVGNQAAAPGRPATATSGAVSNPASPALPPEPPVKPDPRRAKDAYRQGIRAEESKDWEAAYQYYSDAVHWQPSEREYFLRSELAKSQFVQQKMDNAERYAISGKIPDALKELASASALDPTNTVVRDRLAELSAVVSSDASNLKNDFEPSGEVHLDVAAMKRDFDYRGDTTGAYQELARQFGVEVAFDVDMRPRPVRLHLDAVDFATAAQILGEMTGTFWRPLARHLFFVAEDSPQKRKDYDVSLVRTIVLPASETSDEMTEILRLIRDITGITRSDLDTQSRTLTLRASPRAIAVANELVEDLEKPQGELILEIEILEVDRDRARQLGITPPQQSTVYTLNSQEIQEAEGSAQGLINVITQVFGAPSSISGLTATQVGSLLSSGQLSLGSLIPPLVAFGGGDSTFLATLPGATINVAEMLSLVQHGRRILLRAQDGQPATFFVGDRIPVSLAQYSPSEGGTGTTVPGVLTSDFPLTTYSVGNAPTYVASAVLSSNGFQDLIAANFSDSTVSVLAGNGDGTFDAQATYPTGTGPVSIATGDFNKDGNLDLAVANQTAGTVSILLGNGDGTFQAKTDIAAGVDPVSVVAANLHDLNAKGNLDLVVANGSVNTLTIFQGNGDGTFLAPTIVSLPNGSNPAAIAALDLNSDGHIDLAVANSGANTLSIFLGNGDGTFQPRTDYTTGTLPVWVATGDFNGDGIPDIAVANKNDNTVSIFLGDAGTSNASIGNGTFAGQVTYAAGNAPTSIAVADYNIDGRPDLAVTDETDNAVSLLLGIGGGVFGPNLELGVGTNPISIVSADFNADGRADAAIANNGSNDLSVILNSASFSGALNGLSATPFPGVEYLDIGLKVKATPRIHQNNDEVTLKLEFEISSLSGQSFNTIPVITSETVDQTVRVKENQTSMIAGILQGQLGNTINGTPGIGTLPGLGFLGDQNATNQESELLILVTPRTLRFAPRTEHVIYAGQGSPDTAGAAPSPLPQPPPPPPSDQQPQPPAQQSPAQSPPQPPPPSQPSQQAPPDQQPLPPPPPTTPDSQP